MFEPIKIQEIRLEGGCFIIKPVREDIGKAMALIKGLMNRQYTLEIKQFRKKRSLDANQKLWALINEMSTIIHLTPEEIYQGYIPDVGDNYHVYPVKPEKLNEEAYDWCYGHLGRMVEDMGPCRIWDLRGYHNVRFYKGSSEYDVPTFQRLLDLVIQDCRNLGIETMSDRERSLLMEEWGATYAERHESKGDPKAG